MKIIMMLGLLYEKRVITLKYYCSKESNHMCSEVLLDN